MKISVVAKPKSKKEFVKKLGDKHYSVAIKEEAKEEKANAALIRTLADYFNIPKPDINIISGLTSKQKVIELPLSENELKEIENSKILQPKLL